MKNDGRSAFSKTVSAFFIGLLIGVSVIAMAVSMFVITMSAEPWHLLVIIPAVILEYFILTVIHEAGHLIFGLISGYGFSSFRIGSFMWIKLPEGVSLRRISIAGTGGQCLMTPPEEKKGRMPVFLYNLGGALANLVFAMLLFVMYLLLRDVPILAPSLIMGVAISLVMAAFNGLPLKLGGISNDGMNAFSLRNDIHANSAFRKQLLINSAQTEGARLSEMPEEWFELSSNADINNPLCATILAFYCNRLMDEGKFDETEKSIVELINGNNGLMGMYRGMLISDLIYCLLLKGETTRAARYYTKEQRTFMNALKKIPGILRTEYALAICKIDGAHDAEKIKRNFDKVVKKYPYPTDAALERRLISLIEEKCNNT